MSKLETNTIDNISGSSTLTIGDSNTSTIALKSGATLTNFPTNTPAFEAHLSSSGSTTNNTATKVQCNTELYDTDNAYDNSTNYRFTPQTAGKYFVYGKMRVDENASNCNKLINYIYKNGSNYTYSLIDFDANYGEGGTAMNGSIVDMNGSSDYVEMYVYTLTNNGNAMTLEGGSDRPTIFGAYRIIT